MTGLTPPGRSEHGFGYNAVDLDDTYTPPEVGMGDTKTEYGYNLRKQPTLVTRPDGKTIGFSYDTNGRLQELILPDGEKTYVYHGTTGMLANIFGQDGEVLSFGYDGSLPTNMTWNGVITGNVNLTYDNNFRANTQNVNGSNIISYTYEEDGLLKTAGDLTLNYHQQNGMLIGSMIGNISEGITYNSFGEAERYQATYNGNTIYDVQYSNRDKFGRIITKTETVNSETHTYTYNYNLNTDWLTDVHKDGVLIYHYDYDANGNRIGYTGMNGTIIGNYDAQDRMLTYGTDRL